MPIQPLGDAATYTTAVQPSAVQPSLGSLEPEASGQGFAEALGAVIQEANRDQVDAARQAVDLALHGRGTIHDAMVAADNAEGSFRLLMEMRNRIVEGVNRLLETQL